jgi:transcriptional regulator with XRE-family HTH domain
LTIRPQLVHIHARMPSEERVVWRRFGALTMRLREEEKLTLRELSRRVTAEMGGRGLSPTYLSEIERGLKAPPRLSVLKALARILHVPVEKLKLAADGWIVLDAAETLAPFAEYRKLLSKYKGTFDWKPSVVVPAMLDAMERHPAKSEKRGLQVFMMPRGKSLVLFTYWP